MGGVHNIEVRVENLLVRFTPSPAVDLEEAIERLGGVRNGDVIIKMLEAPRATLIIDAKGRIIVHGTHRIEAARAAAKEMLLRMGRDDSGLVAELGPIVASFDFGDSVPIHNIRSNLGSGTTSIDERLGCMRLNDTRHDLELLIWPTGKCVALEARHPNMVAMAAVHWKGKFADKKSLKA
jgi:TATA-box binding protein (TBP) (component of TFIID and TFIIIB)